MPIGSAAAAAIFAQARALCTAEAGALWNHSLCGPMIVVDPRTREAIRSRDLQVAEPFTLPADQPVANSAGLS